MCWATVKNLFRKTEPRPHIVGKEAPVSPKPTIPYPEEQPDYSRTVANTDVTAVLDVWLTKYKVPEKWHSYWLTKIDIKVVEHTIGDYPAMTFEQNGVRHLEVRPAYCNPGVIAHEQAHNSYALLSDMEKWEFKTEFEEVKNDPLVKLLYSTNTYGLTIDIENHAELYRYLNDKMPATLLKFYPRLIEV